MVLALLIAMSPAELREEPFPQPFARLVPLATPKRPPAPGDWLSVHDEPGQSYAEFVNDHPRDPKKRVIDVQPLGDVDPALTVEYLRIYFGGLPVKVLEKEPLSVVPETARRRDQILTTWVLDRLAKQRADDPLALIALTSADLYPDPSWNFVFGRASHMLGVPHCTAWECLMNGSNHQAEKDARPLALCPHDLAKLCHALGGCDLRDRFGKLAQFLRAHGLDDDAAVFDRERAAP